MFGKTCGNAVFISILSGRGTAHKGKEDSVMALTRKFLSALGIDADKVDEIINAHAETVDGLKEQVKQYKEDAEKLTTVQKELDELKAAKDGGEAYEQKYNQLKAEYDGYKNEVQAKELATRKEAAYRNLLKETGVSDKRLDSVLKVTDLSKVELGEDGKLKDTETLAANIKSEWADFIVTSSQQGAKTATPPSGGGKVFKTKDEIMAITDTPTRQKAIAENHELFGF